VVKEVFPRQHLLNTLLLQVVEVVEVLPPTVTLLGEAGLEVY
jgi:hypothetical protein